MVYGYARVSSRDQKEARQIAALVDYGVEMENIYVDKQSGKDFEREEYKRLVGRIMPGDLIVVQDIDRLGRNYSEILEQWRIITKEKACDISVISISLLDTRASRDLTGIFISDLTLQILSYAAETERRSIRQRQAEGIAIAKEKGVRFGRPPMEKPDAFHDVEKEWQCGRISARGAALKLGVNRATFMKWIRES